MVRTNRSWKRATNGRFRGKNNNIVRVRNDMVESRLNCFSKFSCYRASLEWSWKTGLRSKIQHYISAINNQNFIYPCLKTHFLMTVEFEELNTVWALSYLLSPELLAFLSPQNHLLMAFSLFSWSQPSGFSMRKALPWLREKRLVAAYSVLRFLDDFSRWWTRYKWIWR